MIPSSFAAESSVILLLAIAWLLTYAIHSTVFLSGMWMASRFVKLPLVLKDSLWKVALVGGLVTASWQVAGIGAEPMGGRMALSRPEAADVSFAANTFRSAPERASDVAVMALSSPVTAIPEAKYLGAGSGTVHPDAPGWRERVGALPWMQLVLGLWLLGTALSLTRLVSARVHLGRRLGRRREIREGLLPEILLRLRRRGGINRSIRLTASRRIPGPVAVGRSEICLPERAVTDLTPEQQESVLAHELAHLVRRDPSWRVLAAVMEGVFFFQPLNRVAGRHLDEAAEYLSDDWAVRQTGRSLALAKCLAEVAGWVTARPRPVMASAMAEGGSPLVRRVERLLTEGRPRQIARPLRIAAGLALLGAVGAAAPGVVTEREPGEEPEESNVWLSSLVDGAEENRARFVIPVRPAVVHTAAVHPRVRTDFRFTPAMEVHSEARTAVNGRVIVIDQRPEARTRLRRTRLEREEARAVLRAREAETGLDRVIERVLEPLIESLEIRIERELEPQLELLEEQVDLDLDGLGEGLEIRLEALEKLELQIESVLEPQLRRIELQIREEMAPQMEMLRHRLEGLRRSVECSSPGHGEECGESAKEKVERLMRLRGLGWS